MSPECNELSACFLVGPTAVGKTDVAHILAARLGCDLLSVDSMQIYEFMDIGTAKPSRQAQKEFSYGGLDLVAPDKSFSVWDFRVSAIAFIKEAAARGRRVIAVGGSGLYVKSLTNGLRPVSPASEELRSYWGSRLKDPACLVEMQQQAKSLNPAGFEALKDKNNPRRLIRLLEKDEAGDISGGSWSDADSTPLVGLAMDPLMLRQRIEARSELMFKKGIVDEAGQLRRDFGTLSRTAQQAIGYREAFDVLDGKLAVSDAVASVATRTSQYAKRQRTWFRHQAEVKWVDVCAGMKTDAVADAVMALWNRQGSTSIVV